MKPGYLMLLFIFTNLFFSDCKKPAQDATIKSSAKELTNFAFLKTNNPSLAQDVIGNISGNKIFLIVPAGTTTTLVANFSNSDKSKVYVGTTEQRSASTINDFSSPIDYKVVAEDGSYNVYSVSISFSKSTQKELLSFSFLKSLNPTLPSDMTGVISGNKIALTVPPGVSKNLIASFVNSARSKVYIGTTEQKSGITVNDFSNTVDYKVIAEDSSANVYSVTVTFLKSTQKNLLSFTFLKSLNPGLPSDIIGTIAGGNVSVIVPPGISKNLISTFTNSDKSKVYIGSTEQQSGITRNDFSNTLNYKVVAEDSSGITYPVSVTQDAFTELDNLIKDVMSQNGIPGFSIAIVKNEKLVYVNTYGYADKENLELVKPNSLFRIASISKPITGIAILKLLEEGKLSLNQTVFGANGVLGNDYGVPPPGSKKDQITIKHLLDHTSGWTNEPTDPMAYNLSWSFKELITDMVLNRPLKNNPGDIYYYLNFGYCVLGRVIEKITGMSYEQYVKSQVLAPCGITAMKIGGNTLSDRFPDEVKYYSSHFSPYWMNVYRMDSHGGWIASAIDFVGFPFFRSVEK